MQGYDTKQEAEAGHQKWVDTMTGENLPGELTDCCNSGIQELAAAFGAEVTFKRTKK